MERKRRRRNIPLFVLVILISISVFGQMIRFSASGLLALMFSYSTIDPQTVIAFVKSQRALMDNMRPKTIHGASGRSLLRDVKYVRNNKS